MWTPPREDFSIRLNQSRPIEDAPPLVLRWEAGSAGVEACRFALHLADFAVLCPEE